MKNRTAAFLILLLMSALTLGDLALHYPNLPERMASHFGPSGEVNGWMSKAMFVQFVIAICAFDNVLLIGIALRLHSLPNESINLPDKAIWLAPERRESTLAFLSAQMLWLGAATQALLAGVFHLVYQANLSQGIHLGNTVWIYLAAFVAFSIWWTIGLLRRFRGPA